MLFLSRFMAVDERDKPHKYIIYEKTSRISRNPVLVAERRSLEGDKILGRFEGKDTSDIIHLATRYDDERRWVFCPSDIFTTIPAPYLKSLDRYRPVSLETIEEFGDELSMHTHPSLICGAENHRRG